LQRFCQQGWEHLNGGYKLFYRKNSAHEGVLGKSGKYISIVETLMGRAARKLAVAGLKEAASLETEEDVANELVGNNE
jgi:hypothetical protein